jgi:hypothetical protein
MSTALPGGLKVGEYEQRILGKWIVPRGGDMKDAVRYVENEDPYSDNNRFMILEREIYNLKELITSMVDKKVKESKSELNYVSIFE